METEQSGNFNTNQNDQPHQKMNTTNQEMKIMATSGKSGTSNNPAGIPRTNSLGQDEYNYTNYMKNIQKFGMSKTEWRMRGCPDTQTSERNNTNYAN